MSNVSSHDLYFYSTRLAAFAGTVECLSWTMHVGLIDIRRIKIFFVRVNESRRYYTNIVNI